MLNHNSTISSSKEKSDPSSYSDIKVSIIIPVYNVEEYLSECLDSVLNQSLKEIEVICVDDGSTDNSPYILKEYAGKDQRIQVITQENSGSGVARNKAIEYVQGEYIGFIDSDDWVDHSMFEKLYENAKLKNSDMIMCPILIVNDNGGELNDSELRSLSYYNLDCFDESFNDRVFNYKDSQDFLLRIAVNVYNKIFKTSMVRECNAKFAEGLLFQDNIFHYHTYLNASRVSIIRDFLYFHRIRRSGSVQTEKGEGYYDIIPIQNMIMDIFKQLPDYHEQQLGLINKKINQIIMRYFQVAEEYRAEFFRRIKEDFQEMNLEDNIIDELQAAARKKYINILNSETYREFELHHDKEQLLYRINMLNKKNNELIKSNDYMREHLKALGYLEYKSKNIAVRLKNKLLRLR